MPDESIGRAGASRVERAAGVAVPVLVLVLACFAVWALHLVLSVAQERAALEEHVRWLSAAHELQVRAEVLSSPAEPPSAAEVLGAREALETLRAELGAMRSQPELASWVEAGEPELTGLLREIERRDRVGMQEWSIDVLAWLGRLVGALRARMSTLSSTLGERWTEMYVLVAIALGLALAVAFLFGWALRLTRRARELDEALANARAREARAAHLSSQGKMLAHLSHQLSGPLTIVTNNLQPLGGYSRQLGQAALRYRGLLEKAGRQADAQRIAAEEELDLVVQDFPDALAAVDAAAGHLRGVARELSGFLEGKRPRRSMANVSALVQSTLRALRRALPEGAQVRTELGEVPEIPVYPEALGQAVLALVDNAASAIGPGGEVRVSVRDTPDAIEIAVEDDGPGVAAAHHQDIFEPFFTTRGEQGAAGLGLAVCRHVIVARHLGELELDAAPRGARFVARLPKVVASDEAVAPFGQASLPPPPRA